VSYFIAIEGSDGSGKGTQTQLLVDYVQNKLKKPVLKLSFPRYDQPSAAYVARYLNGEYGELSPEPASFLYAFDRFMARKEIDEFLEKNPDGVVISDRYMASNLGHQGGKITNKTARYKFYKEIRDLEFNQFQIARPDINIVLTVPADVAQTNVDKKAARNYTDKKRDLHEGDKNHLLNATACFKELCEIYPDEFTEINCYDHDKKSMLSIEQIQELILDILPL
jgi:Thymidylate kinase